MCNLYFQTKSRDALRHVFGYVMEEGEGFEDQSSNLAAMSGI